MNVDKTSLESKGVLVSKNSREQSIGNAKPHAVEKNVDSHLIESGSPTLVHNGKGKKQLMQDPQFPPWNSLPLAPQALFKTDSTTLDGSRSSWLGKQPLNILKENHPCMNPRQSILSHSNDEKDETLASMFSKNLGRLLQCSIKSSDPKLQSSKAMKVIIEGRPRVGQSAMEESPKAKKKRIMEPFAISPSNKLNAGRSPCKPYG